MKSNTMLNYEKETGGNFFELSNRISDGSYNMTDVMHMLWCIRFDKDPTVKLKNTMESNVELDEILKEITASTKNV